MSKLRKMLDRINGMLRKSDLQGWEDPAQDAIQLSWHVERLVQQVHSLNERREEPEDLCPACASWRWGRPYPSDYTQRVCSDCREIRPEPEKEGRHGDD